MKQQTADNLDLTVSSTPSNVLEIVRSGKADALTTRSINIFYALADYLEKSLHGLKDKCRPIIIARRNEGEVSGSQAQHRTFTYQLPTGNIDLTVQERIVTKPDPNKLETLLRTKNLWESAVTTTLDMVKVDALCVAGLITDAEIASVSDPPKPTYALVARFSKS